MSKSTEGRRWQGRFIRKQDPILDHINISSFNLVDISVHPTAVPDNARNSILHKRLHHPDEFDSAIHQSFIATNEFEPEGGKRPVLVPLDFTKDWELMKKRITKRNTRFDDDEDDLDIYEASSASQDTEEKKPTSSDENNKTTPEQQQPNDDTQTIPDEATVPTGEALNSAPLTINKEKEALDSIAKSLPVEDQNPLGAGIAPEQQTNEFKPLNDNAIDHQQNHPENQTEPIDEDSEGRIKDAEQEGFNEGYKKGVNEAFEEVQKDYDEKSKTIANMMSELEGLKKDILHNAQENFQTICESIMEAILQKEYRAHPESFGMVIKRAIDEAVDSDVFNIRVHPDHIEDLSRLYKGAMADHVIGDESIPPGDFKIESEHKVVDGKIKKLIGDLLEQANVDLFHKGEAS